MNFNNKFIEKTSEVVASISNNRYLKAVSKAMVAAIPVLMIGSISLLITKISIPGWQDFLIRTKLMSLLTLSYSFSINMISLVVVYFVSYNLARSFNKDGGVIGILGFLSFFIMTPTMVTKLNETARPIISIPVEWLGSKGMFVAIIIGLLTARTYVWFMDNKIYLKMPPGVPDFVEKSFASLVPFAAIILLFSLVSVLFTLTSYENIHNFIFKMLQVPLQHVGGSLGGVFVAYIAMSLLWLFGIHGKALVFAVVAPLWAANSAENMAASQAGQIPPHLIDFGFTTIFMEIGGAGCIFALSLLMLFAKSERYKTIGKVTFVPTLFGINEPITFATPVVLNPILAIPFMLSPLVGGTLGYLAIKIGLVGRMTGASLPTGVPTFLNALIIAGWRGFVAQVLVISVLVLLYLPFFKRLDKEALEQEDTEKLETSTTNEIKSTSTI